MPPSSLASVRRSLPPTGISSSSAPSWSHSAPARTKSAQRPSDASDDPAPDRVDGGLDAVVDLELHEDVRDVVLDRLRADVELAGDHCVVLPVRDQLQDLDLAVRELSPDRALDLRLRAGRAHAL